ncbi:hypothetical protein CFOL_v3_01630 [Cephalotus follicularis]|uniref:Uncharacterized protein n=1 Tax=Cephalotus follicularis TaxID=3775 RepID=A0A1Q3AQQ8_CEPFO|nr:hypothetical protein CFOL_v3_01630 [Cephalotus follicularis]
MGTEVTTMTKITMVVEVSRAPNAHHSAQGDAARPNIISHACSSVRSAAKSACVCPRGIMGIKMRALATTTGRPRKVDLSALEQYLHNYSIYLLFPSLRRQCGFVSPLSLREGYPLN